jgi:tetratricopeptide (TPR) repeat protein
MFLEKRVYQGSSGCVYPLPFTDRIAETPRPRAWEAVFIENEFIRVMILPALGGRIHRAQDKTNGYDFIYYQPVIKPALVGLAGPWASGGIEFNWPQHHRPSTFMPADVAIEHRADGSATVWLSEHDPLARMKGMHGVRLHPGKSYLELVARVYNRTPDVQTFLWWANVATRAHEQYQSFFPPDVSFVADHARRAMSTFPLCGGHYYGVDYAARGRGGIPAPEVPRQFVPSHCRNRESVPNGDGPAYAPNDLSWYANIPVPTSYMGVGSQEDFAGGYDHKAHAGLVQIANHHISPGKKQWTWGNHEFGYAWDRNLTDRDERGECGPYIELMAGVYTDNQPDFSFLQPGETKSWSQFWYPIRRIGPAQKANVDAAVSLRVAHGVARIGVAVTSVQPDARVQLACKGSLAADWTQTLAPDRPLTFETLVARRAGAEAFTLRVLAAGGRELIAYTPQAVRPGELPPAATEPPAPAQVASNDELFVIGLHLEQYRHATRPPEIYWREALRRDPGDSRCNLALGRWHLRRGELADAEKRLRASIARLVTCNSNPADGEPYYQLGLCLRQQAFAEALDPARLEAAYAAFYKATWNHAWQPAGFHALAEIDALRGDWAAAQDHLERALRVNADNLRARDLQAVVLRRLGRPTEAGALLTGTLALDPADWWARHLQGERLTCDTQVRLDLALDCARAGLFREALTILDDAPAAPRLSRRTKAGAPAVDLPDASLGTGPLVHYYRAWLCHLIHDQRAERRHLAAAAKAPPDFCFPARRDEITILQHAIAANPRDARAPFYLGNLLYDRRRHREAIRLWERAVKLEPGNAVAWRNLGIGYFNILRRPAAARGAYERAFRARPSDARLFYERDQLWKRLGEMPARRLRELRRHRPLVQLRDDLSVELCALCNQTGAPHQALPVITSRKFQPWEGGEGQALGQHVRTHFALGRHALRQRNAARAISHFRAALAAPENLGEAKHLLANQSDLHYWLGCALAARGDRTAACAQWTAAAEFKGDFQAMTVCAFSEMTYYSACALDRLGRKREAHQLLRGLLAEGRALARAPATINYFATSLPTMLLFDDDLQIRQRTTALFLQAQARLGLGQTAEARKLLRAVLRRDPNHALAADLLTVDADRSSAQPPKSSP